MAATASKTDKKKGAKHWVFFALRWAVAIVGVWLVVRNMSLHDQALVVLDKTTRIPQLVRLQSDISHARDSRALSESSSQFPVIDPANPSHIINVDRADVLNSPDVKQVQLADTGEKLYLLGVDLEGDLAKNPVVKQLLVAKDPRYGPARWISPALVPGYTDTVPYPRIQQGLESMVRGAKASLLWAALLIFPLTFLITSYRWHELLKALDIRMTQSRTFVLNMVGSFYNSFLPGSTGGDAFKAYYASLQTTHRTRAVMSVLVDRAVGLLALIIVGGVTASFQWHIEKCRQVAIGAAIVCACTAIGMLLFYNKTLHRLSGLDFVLKKLPMQKQVRGAVDAMQKYGKRPGLALWTLIVSLPVHGAVVTSAMFAGMAFGLPLHWEYYWVAVPVIVLAAAIPISPQGAGVMEGFALLLTRPQGVTPNQVVALTMSIRMVQIIWNLSGGLFVLRGGFHAPTEGEKKSLDNLPPEPGSGDDNGLNKRDLVPA